MPRASPRVSESLARPQPQAARHIEALRLQARALPEAPGVYLWKDERGRILYIGKAVNLRARVTSYFSSARSNRRIREMLSHARTIQHELTRTELEALLLESALIKREQPDYNRALKITREPYYGKLDASLRDPYLEMSRGKSDDGSLYFGPFRSPTVLRETMRYLHDVLPLRKCTAQRPRCRSCIYYQMKTCAAPMIDEEHRQRHQEAIAGLFHLLDGRGDKVAAWLERKRDRLSESLLFEQAAEVQNRLDLLRDLMARHTLLEAAMRSRCVLVYQPPTPRDGARIFLVAHGHAISMLVVEHPQVESLAAWVRAHEPVLQAAVRQQSEVDAAAVLERWLTVNRKTLRWVVVPQQAAHDDLVERLEYLLRDAG